MGKKVVVSQEFMLDVAKLVYALDEFHEANEDLILPDELVRCANNIQEYMLEKIKKHEHREEYQAMRKTR